MTDEKETRAELVVRPDYDGELRTFEQGLLRFVSDHDLPSANIMVPVHERLAVFQNLERVLIQLPQDQRRRAIYISKLIAATAAGLFDAALNYLWDETISELRRRAALYDLPYFLDIAVQDPERRKRLNTEEDLSRVEDSELIRAANKIGLISDLGYRHLDYVRYMRNWASAAHPNQNQITGLQVVAWLETCLREVVAVPISPATVQIGKLLANVKANRIDAAEAQQIGTFFGGLPQDRADPLAAGFFGIYCQAESSAQSRDNIRLLLPRLWPLTSEEQRKRFGIKYAQYVANNDQEPARLAREGLDLVGGAPYIPEGLLAAEIETALQNLLSAHHGFNNFYNEPAFARQLQTLVSGVGALPSQMEARYVTALVEVFLTNGNGVAWSAETTYIELLGRFTSSQAVLALLSFQEQAIASKLQFSLAQGKWRELVAIVDPKLAAPAARQLLGALSSFGGPLERMRDDSSIKRAVATYSKITGP